MSKKAILAAVKQELRKKKEVDEVLEDEDAEFEPGEGALFLPRRKKSAGEIAIDEMLVGLEGNDWYLKLSKEVTPNTYQFKKRINEFHHWSDMELEVNTLIRAETLAEYKKYKVINRWGSGKYRVEFWKEGGIRGEKRKPVFFDIDAEEPETNNTQDANLGIVQDIINSQPKLDPADVTKLTIDSLHKGMELATLKDAKAESTSGQMMQLMMAQMQSSTQMMVGLMTAIMQNKPIPNDTVTEMNKMAETFKNMGLIGVPKAEKSMLEQVKELQELGIIKKPDSDDAIKSIENIKKIASIIGDMGGAGAGERPGVIEKIIDVVGNNIPGIVNAVNTMAAAQAKRPMVIQPQPRQVIQQPERSEPEQLDAFSNGHELIEQEIQVPPMPASPEGGYQQPTTIRKEEENNKMEELANSLWRYVEAKDYSRFDEITQILGNYFGGPINVSNMIANGQLTAQSLLNYILLFDKRYVDKSKFIALQDYANHYIASFNPVIEQGVVGKCQLCGNEFDFNSKQEYLDEQGENEGKVICGTDGCQGEVALQ